MEGMGLIFTALLVRHVLGSLGLSWHNTAFLGLIDTINSSTGKHNLPLGAHGHPPTMNLDI